MTGSQLIDQTEIAEPAGGLNLHIQVERIADPSTLPVTVTGALTLTLPRERSAVYLRAAQSDGHQIWTSPLFVTRPQAQPR
ncbi:hypothetical protein BST16_27045 [Mycobacterium asiaticum DSM 44297]|nr:hypothetical protein BST16_27045 [Mycobacterium asiaticum DSM 44297]